MLPLIKTAIEQYNKMRYIALQLHIGRILTVNIVKLGFF